MCLKVSANQVKFKILSPDFILKYFHECFMLDQHIFQTMGGYGTAYSISHVLLHCLAVINMYSYSQECKFVVMYK